MRCIVEHLVLQHLNLFPSSKLASLHRKMCVARMELRPLALLLLQWAIPITTTTTAAPPRSRRKRRVAMAHAAG